ncbi:MAG TPA: GNAT family N-acetyltransferase [Ktedonobacteraceae bacterium]|jgi:GNAT superfamily N-acetyltransferase|nr:GNAT family N-acetyltransferase [Ktedonobacteraceae bacterium]
MTTTSDQLPGDFMFRPPVRDEAQAIIDGVIACEVAERGKAETILEDLFDMWQAEGFDLQNDARVLVAPDGAIIGYTGLVHDDDDFMLDPQTYVHPAFQGRGLEHHLLRFAEQRARQQRATATISVWSFSPAWTKILQQEGYTVISSSWRMEIVLQEAPPEPQPLEGIDVRLYIPGEDEYSIHAVVQEAFADIGGHPYRPFEEWQEAVLEHPHFDPSMLYIAEDGDRIVGAVICRTYSDPPGFINQVAVLRPWRKRGIALHLLQTVFAEYYRRGITSVILDVDTHNVTGAHQLYERAGMRRSTQVDRMEKKL